MTDNEIRQIFSRFQNLNLIVLIEDLRRNLVARVQWLRWSYYDPAGKATLCPLAHGWTRGGEEFANFARCGVPPQIGRAFTGDWDRGVIGPARLTCVLSSILRERQEDADCVQGITGAVVGQEAMVTVQSCFCGE